ncbi:hypothetical protein Bca52824_081985 [Brassica carinata]|uniref:Uncharacterized protein n=1 Tax=Brassica carinata TaxID=52824 RepID=A0A8X7TS47_BRACI|nr:hypothetical protein Bca52824_081985 [Brassica carinata]
MDPSPASMWSSIVKKDPPSNPPTTDVAPSAVLGMVGNCKSTKGISMAVVDANAVIDGRQSLTDFADKFVTVPEVLSEIRDADSRRRLEFIPFTIETMEPSPESLSKVIKFAKATGDLHTLSDVDLKLIALTYTLEAEVHGTKNLRDVPPPIQTVRVKRLPEKELPGWGSNILPLKDLNMNILASDSCSEVGSVASHTEEEGGRSQKRYPPKKTEVKLEGKMVVEGIDASQGENDDEEDGGEWRPAVSSSTHRKFLRRKAKWEHYNALAEQEIQKDQEADKAANLIQDTNDQMSNDNAEGKCAKGSGKNDEELSSILKDMRLEETNLSNSEDDIDVASEAGDTFESSSMADDGSSEQSWSLRALSEWVLKCHACYTVTPEIGRIFCPKCGNGGTLRKVAVTIGENGTIIAARKPRVTLQGTKFSIPMPKSGRDAITKNLVLREDQLPQKYLHPKTKKKASKPGDEYFISDDVFLNHHSDRKASLQPPVRKAMAVFSQKRNPNDNHYSRSMHC